MPVSIHPVARGNKTRLARNVIAVLLFRMTVPIPNPIKEMAVMYMAVPATARIAIGSDKVIGG